jgi:hypothetical protein
MKESRLENITRAGNLFLEPGTWNLTLRTSHFALRHTRLDVMFSFKSHKPAILRMVLSGGNMCFSASASFTSSVLLTVIGTETLRKVHKPSQIVFACVPLFFAFQQFTEGVLWLAIAHAGFAGLQVIATYVFMVMAQVIWPVLIPLSVLLMEQNKARKRVMFILLLAGATAALYYLYRLIFFGIHAEISGLHISYSNPFRDSFGATAVILYVAATLGSLFVSSIKRTHVLGMTMVLAFLISAVFYTQCLTSVWCFFAAVISFGIFYIIRDAHKKFHLDKEALKKIIAEKILPPVLKPKHARR